MRTICHTLILILLLKGLSGCNTGATPPPIVIGHVSDKTRLDKAGEQTELGIRLALHESSKDDAYAEVFAGRKLEVRHTDTRGELDAFESQAVRLDSINRCLALMGGLSAPETNALGHGKVPILTLHGQAAPGASNQVFYLGMSPVQQGMVLAKVVAENPTATQIALLQDERRPEASALAESFEKTLTETRKHNKAAQATILTQRFGKDAKWDDVLMRMNAQQPGVVVFAGTAADFNAWHSAFHHAYAGTVPQIVYAGGDGDQRLFDLAGGNKTPIVLATAFYADPTSEKIAAFMKAHREAFQNEADVHSAVAYDGFRILVEAMKQTATKLTSDTVRDELQKTKDFAGLTGPLTIGTDRVVQRPLFAVRWQNGSLALIKKFDAEKAKE